MSVKLIKKGELLRPKMCDRSFEQLVCPWDFFEDALVNWQVFLLKLFVILNGDVRIVFLRHIIFMDFPTGGD